MSDMDMLDYNIELNLFILISGYFHVIVRKKRCISFR